MFWFVTYSVTLVANWVFDWWSESLLRELSMKQEKFWLSLVETAFQFKYKILLIKSLICLRLNRLATWSAVLICHQRDLFTQINPFTAGMKTQKFLWILKDQNLRLQFGDTCLLVGPLLEPLDVVYLLFVIHLDWNLCRVEETTTFIVGYTLGPVSLWIATAKLWPSLRFKTGHAAHEGCDYQENVCSYNNILGDVHGTFVIVCRREPCIAQPSHCSIMFGDCHSVVRGDFPMAASAANSPFAPLGQIVEWTAKPSPFSIQGRHGL